MEEDVQKIYDSFVEENLDFKFITDAYKFLIYNSLARKLFEKERTFNILVTSFENEVDKLRELDREYLKIRANN